MRLIAVAGALGLMLLVGITLHFGWRDIVEAVHQVGFGVGLVVVARIVAIAMVGCAWWFLVLGPAQVAPQICMLLRWMRESINTLLPVAQVGGEIVGARLLTFWGVSGGRAGASLVVDMFVQVATQLAFTIAGLAILIVIDGDQEIVRYVAIGLLILIPGVFGFFIAQRFGAFDWLERQLMRLAENEKWAALGQVADLHVNIQEIYKRRARLAACVGLHMGTWFFGAIEVWIVLHFLGYPVSVAEALVIESLGQAVRGAAFAVPGGLGVQEGGFIALCAVFGLPPHVAIAMSLVKRVPELLLGLPGLAVWHRLETRELGRRAKAAQEQTFQTNSNS